MIQIARTVRVGFGGAEKKLRNAITSHRCVSEYDIYSRLSHTAH